MANEVTQRDLQALGASCTKLIADVNKRFNDVPSIQSVNKILAEHKKEIQTSVIDLSKRINQLQGNVDSLKADTNALKTAVSQLQTRANRT